MEQLSLGYPLNPKSLASSLLVLEQLVLLFGSCIARVFEKPYIERGFSDSSRDFPRVICVDVCFLLNETYFVLLEKNYIHKLE